MSSYVKMGDSMTGNRTRIKMPRKSSSLNRKDVNLWKSLFFYLSNRQRAVKHCSMSIIRLDNLTNTLISHSDPNVLLTAIS